MNEYVWIGQEHFVANTSQSTIHFNQSVPYNVRCCQYHNSMLLQQIYCDLYHSYVATVGTCDGELCMSIFMSENIALNHFWPSKEKVKLRYF